MSSINDDGPLLSGLLGGPFSPNPFIPAPVMQSQANAIHNAQRHTSATIVKQNRERLQAAGRVLEYIEAQLNMDLFRGDPLCASLFEQAMINAAHQLVNGQFKS